MNKLSATATTLRLLQTLADGLDRDAPMMQHLAFLHVALAGDGGMDQADLADRLGASGAATSRTVQALGQIHYHKDKPGFGLVDQQFDPTNHRKRRLTLTAKGRLIHARVLEALTDKK